MLDNGINPSQDMKLTLKTHPNQTSSFRLKRKLTMNAIMKFPLKTLIKIHYHIRESLIINYQYHKCTRDGEYSITLMYQFNKSSKPHKSKS